MQCGGTALDGKLPLARDPEARATVANRSHDPFNPVLLTGNGWNSDDLLVIRCFLYLLKQRPLASPHAHCTSSEPAPDLDLVLSKRSAVAP